MMAGEPDAQPSIPAGYRVETSGNAARSQVSVFDDIGALAASGYGAAAYDVFAYDRIVVAAAHRRRGLGRLVMGMLGAVAPPSANHVLAATRMGRALYQSIGWQVRSDYTTAFIPGD